MTLYPIDDPNRPELDPYRNLRERTLRGESIFIAEGPLVVERLLRSPYVVESILISDEYSGDRSLLSLVPDAVPIFQLPQRTMIDQIAGFTFYQGILALGRHPELPGFEEGIRQSHLERASGSRHVWVALPDATKPDNLGLVFRAAAALGATGILLGESCCDPFSRRALRVSMGGVLQMPILQSKHFCQELQNVRKEFSISCCATVLDSEAEWLPRITDWPDEIIFLFGNEYSGLSKEQISLCDRKAFIPIRPDIDSLNLGVSVGIFLYDFLTRERKVQP